MTGLKVTEMCAELKAFVPGRPIDDDGAALLRYENGATGVLMATQIAVGETNSLKIRVYGENGGMEWRQTDPNILLLKWSGRPTEIIDVGGNATLTPDALYNTRTPQGHPEGYLEAFSQEQGRRIGFDRHWHIGIFSYFRSHHYSRRSHRARSGKKICNAFQAAPNGYG